MAANNNQEQKTQKDAPHWVLTKARGRKAFINTEMEQAKKRIPKEYHDFLVFLPQNEKLGNGEQNVKYNLGSELYDLDVYFSDKNNAFYMSIEKPYLTVDGRVQMFKDEHAAAGKKFNIHPPVFVPFNDTLTCLSVTIDSEIYGQSTGMIEIGFKSGVDISNPLSNAQTSAIGRALTFLGYGLIGTGAVFSDEEMKAMIEEPPKTQKNPSTSNVQKFSLIVGNIVMNPDGSSTAKGRNEHKEYVDLFFPSEQSHFVNTLQNNDTVEIIGALNAELKRIVVVKKGECKIIKSA